MRPLVQTADGPILEGASPELLRQLLDEWKEELLVLSDGALPFREGLDPHDVEIALAGRNLRAPAEVIEWFSWSDGMGARRDGGISIAPPFLQLLPLDIALTVYDQRRSLLELAAAEEADYDDFTYGAGEGWLLLNSDTSSIAVDCSTFGDAPRVRFASPMFTAFPPASGRFRVRSLCTVVANWIDTALAGAYVWVPETEGWLVDTTIQHWDWTAGPDWPR